MSDKEGVQGASGPKEVGDWSAPKRVSDNPIMKFFDPERYAETEIRNIVGHFRYLAETLDKEIPNSAEKSAGLRKLLEAQDCIIRAVE